MRKPVKDAENTVRIRYLSICSVILTDDGSIVKLSIRKSWVAPNVPSDHPVDGDVSSEPSTLQPPPAAGDDSSDGQSMTFQERIAMERQQKTDGQSPG